MIGSELLRYNKKQKYCLYDVETESLSLSSARPWQLSMIDFTLEHTTKNENRYVWWEDLNVSKRAAAITRFDYEFYRNKAEDARAVLEDLEERFDDPEVILVGHNILGYDLMITNVWRRNVGFPIKNRYIGKVIDTLALSRAYRENIPPDTSSPEAFLAWQYRILSYRRQKMPKTSLGVMAKELGIETDKERLHDASYDTHINMEVFKSLLWKLAI